MLILALPLSSEGAARDVEGDQPREGRDAGVEQADPHASTMPVGHRTARGVARQDTRRELWPPMSRHPIPVTL